MSTKTQNTRAKILQATLDLLFADERASTRMSDVAKRAGVSRQAVYLHFGSRADLLIAATLYLDDQLDTDARLAPSRAAQTGLDRLTAFVAAWGAYIPEIHGVAKALIAMSDTDSAAAAAWDKRMQDMREGCEAAIIALEADGTLAADFTVDEATDVLWTLLSVANWEQNTITSGWSQEKYISMTTTVTRRLFFANPVKTN
jgi:AcrR family transcriptional regulator